MNEKNASDLEVIPEAQEQPLQARPDTASRWHCDHRNGKLLASQLLFFFPPEIPSLRCPCFLGKMSVTMNVPPRSLLPLFVPCQDSCEPVIISGLMRITSPGPTSAPGPGGGEVSGSGSQALAAGWMWLDPVESFRGS